MVRPLSCAPRVPRDQLETRGLTLGKYAPLHSGHQLVIETALEEMAEVIVLIYDAPETTPIPLQVRSGWLRSLYPSVEVMEVRDGPTDVGYTPELMTSHEQCILNVLQGARISHFYSSEPYGDHVSRALGAANRSIDNLRCTIPVSATAVRANPFANRHYLDSVVYKDLVTNVVFLGAPSTGKTTIARELAGLFDTQWMAEYGREYWHAHQRQRGLTPAQLVELARGHLEREEALLLQSNRYLFTDTNAITTAIFSDYYHGGVAPALERICEQVGSRYDLVFVCDTDIPYDDSTDRSGEANRETLQQKTFDFLNARKIPFHLLGGNLSQRIRDVDAILQQHGKWDRANGRD